MPDEFSSPTYQNFFDELLVKTGPYLTKNCADNFLMSKQKSVTQQYQAHLSRVGKSPRTVKAYGYDLAGFTLWWEQTTAEAFNPQVIDPHDIQEFRGYLIRIGHSPTTINRRLKALRGFFRWAKREQLAKENPFEVLEKVMVKQQQNTAPRWLDRPEQLALLRAVRKSESSRDLAIVQTFLGSGLRISELAALTLDDLELSDRKGTLQVRAGKGTKAREIPLGKKTRQALSSYLAERPQMDGQLPEAERGRVFIGQRGALKPRGLEYLIAKYVYQAQLEDCSAHTLRHTFAKNLVDSGTPLDQVAILMGHENLNTTKIYTRPSKQDLEKAVRRAAGEL
jgi:site-specific recombinase XerD